MEIHFNDDAVDSYIWTLNKLTLMTANIDVTNDAYPHESVVIKSVNDDGITVWEAGPDGAPIKNATWVIPHQVVNSVTVI